MVKVAPFVVQTLTEITDDDCYHTRGYTYGKHDIEHYIEFKIGDKVSVRADSTYEHQRYDDDGSIKIHTITDIRYGASLPIQTNFNGYHSYDLEYAETPSIGWVKYDGTDIPKSRISVKDLEEFEVKRI